ncbi:MAG: glycosyltransferase family 39 protein [Lentisphaeria bacterium]|nr:glycosyltransferase family 39 protein [Lentisphaeria bacterium]
MTEMDTEKIVPRALAVENRTGVRSGVLLCAALFVLTFLPWLSAERELFRQEGFYAAIAAECAENVRNLSDGIAATAHHVVMDDAFPLYPTAVSLVYQLGVPMETALRLVSVISLGVLSLLAALAAATRCNFRAGLVAGCCCFGTLFALEKGAVGGPEAMAACFLLSAQLLFFHYGSRLADWNSAWIAAAILISLGFLCAGPIVILFFAFPLCFLRRPLSSSGKFRAPGFIAGVFLVAVVVLSWALPIEFALRRYAAESGFEAVALSRYFRELVEFPLLFPLRMLPWAVVMWMPFCVALQAISPLPVYSLYLRTLFFAALALAWLLPKSSTAQLFFVVGPLAILTGIYYDLGIRRYGRNLRRAVTLGGVLFPLTGVCLLAVCWMPYRFLNWFGSPEKMRFREQPEYLGTVVAALAFLAVLSWLFHLGTRRYPFWVNLLLLGMGIAVIGGAMLLPYRVMEREWRNFGRDVRRALPPDAGRIYKYEIQGMYNGLFYAGKPIYKLHRDGILPHTEANVYVIAPRFPDLPDRSWRPLLPADYTCRGMPVSLWQGVPAAPENGEGRDE